MHETLLVDPAPKKGEMGQLDSLFFEAKLLLQGPCVESFVVKPKN